MSVLRFCDPVNPLGSCRARSVYLTTLLLSRLSSKRLTSIVHILSPETDNCPSWISGLERMTVQHISRSISMKECCRPGGVEPVTSWSPVERPRPVEPPMPAHKQMCMWPVTKFLTSYSKSTSASAQSYQDILVLLIFALLKLGIEQLDLLQGFMKAR